VGDSLSRGAEAGKVKRLALLLFLLAGPAQAATYYVRWDGHDGASGVNNTNNATTGAWQTLGKANASLQPGDVVRVVSMIPSDTSSGAISPANDGNLGAYITYIGNPDSILARGLATITISKQYISVKGFRSRTGCEFRYVSEASKPVGDSISYCHAVAVTYRVAKQCAFVHNELRFVGVGKTVTWTQFSSVGPPCPLDGCCALTTDAQVVGDNFQCEFGKNVVDGGNINHDTQAKGFYMTYSHECVIDSNQFSFTFSQAADSTEEGDIQGCYYYNSQDIHSFDNKWTIEASGRLRMKCPSGCGTPWDPWQAFAARDSFIRCSFTRDSFFCGVTSGYPIRFRFSNTGACNWSNSNGSNTWSYCFIKATGGMWTQGIFNANTVDHCILYAGKAAKNHTTVAGSRVEWTSGNGNTWTHNTMIGSSNDNFGTVFSPGTTWQATTGNTYKYNIYYSDSSYANGINEMGTVYYGQTNSGNQVDLNLIYAPKEPSAGWSYNHSLEMPGGAGSPFGWGTGTCISSAYECGSKFGSPRFADSSFATFNGRPIAGSYAIGAYWETGGAGQAAGGYCGAIPPSDVTPPDSIPFTATYDGNSCGPTCSLFDVNWTDVGDDGMVGGEYSVKIIVAEWEDAIPNAASDWSQVYDFGPSLSGLDRTVKMTANYGIRVCPCQFNVVIQVCDEAGNCRYSTRRIQ
jgi:hypothetical protein